MIDLKKERLASQMLSSGRNCFRNPLLLGALFAASPFWNLSAQPGGGSNPNIAPRPKLGEKAPDDLRTKTDIRIDSTLVLIPVTVTDPLNRFVTGLDKDNFRVFEDKKEQQLTQFSSEDAPLAVGVIFDCSGSMGHKLEKSRLAVAQFFKTANPEDEFFLVTFADRAELVQP